MRPGRIVQIVTKTVQGEGILQGLYPVSLVRFSGCPLNCPFCDTKELWRSKEDLSLFVEDLSLSVQDLAPNLMLTGGEPLLYENVKAMDRLGIFHRSYGVLFIETSFSVPAEEQISFILSKAKVNVSLIFAVSPKLFNSGNWAAVERNLDAFVEHGHPGYMLDLKLLAPWPFSDFPFLRVAKLFLDKLGPRCNLVVMPLTDKEGRIEDKKATLQMAEQLWRTFQHPVIISPRLHFVLGVE